jgi:thiol-disulfide isomerase/thioredoxin
VRSCADPVHRKEPVSDSTSNDEVLTSFTSAVDNSPVTKPLSQSEKMAALLGRDVDADRVSQKEKSRILIEELRVRKRYNRQVAVGAVIIGIAASIISNSNPASSIVVLHRLEELSSPVTAIGNGKPTLLDVYAEWCTNCKAMSSGLYDLKLSELGREINFITLNADNPKIAAVLDRFHVDGIPHFALLDKSGDVRATFIGTIPMSVLQDDLAALVRGKEKLPYPGINYQELFQNGPQDEATTGPSTDFQP